MSAPIDPPSPRQNRLLALLNGDVLDVLARDLRLVELEVPKPLQQEGKPIRHVHFPISGVVSMLASVVGAEARIEVGTVGNEGMAGLPAFLGTTESPNDCSCQIPGRALRLPAAQLRRFLAGDGALHHALHRYTQATMVFLAQNVACNRLHSTEARCARWLLQTRDRTGTDDFPLTQEFLAQMLGVRRGTVSLTAGALQEAGVISYSRGRITVLDAEALHERACDCYDIVQAEFRRLTAAPEA